MITTTARWPSVRCRLGWHSWRDVARSDGQYLRTCTRCLEERGPFAWYERQPPPRDGPGIFPV